MMSWATAFRLRQYAKASLWIIPLLGLVLGVLLADAAVWLEGMIQLPEHWRYSPSTASSVLSTIVGAMVALLGFVVTIGILVVQQATGTLSPRYMRLWYRDRLQKAVLATFTGTFAFAFSLLRLIETDFVPNLGVTLAGTAVAVSLLLLLIYLNRFIHNLRPVAIAALVSGAGRRLLERGLALQAKGTLSAGEPKEPLPDGPVTLVRTERGGAVQGINAAGLTAAAERHDCVLVLRHPVGDFVPPGAALVAVHGASPDGHRAIDHRELTGYVALGVERTIEQDPAFALRILVDVAIRALSPAVNDPTTAVQVLNHIEAMLHNIGRVELHRVYTLRDRRGHPRLVVPGRSWEDFLQLALTEIREYGADSTQVCRRLRALLQGLLGALTEGHLPPVRAQLTLLDEAVAQAFTDPARRATALIPDRQGIGGGSGEAPA